MKNCGLWNRRATLYLFLVTWTLPIGAVETANHSLRSCASQIIDTLVLERQKSDANQDLNSNKRIHEATLSSIFELLIETPENQKATIQKLTLSQKAALGRNLVLLNTYFQHPPGDRSKQQVRYPQFVLEPFLKIGNRHTYEQMYRLYLTLPKTHILKRFAAELVKQQPGTRFQGWGGQITESLLGCAKLRFFSALDLILEEILAAPAAKRRELAARFGNFPTEVWKLNTAIVRGFMSFVYTHVPDPAHYLNLYLDALYGLDGHRLHRAISRRYEGKDISEHTTYMGLPYEAISSSYGDIEIGLKALGLKKGQTVVDIGAGYGRVGLAVSSHYPGVHFTGYELVPERAQIAAHLGEVNRFANYSIRNEDAALPGRLAPADVYYFYEPTNAAVLENVFSQLETIQYSRRGRIKILAKPATGQLLKALRSKPWLRETSRVYSDGDLLYHVFEGTARNQVGIEPRDFFEINVQIDHLKSLSTADLFATLLSSKKPNSKLFTDEIQSLVLDRVVERLEDRDLEIGEKSQWIETVQRIFEIRKISDPLLKRRFYQIVKRFSPGRRDGSHLRALSLPLPWEVYEELLADCEVYQHEPRSVAGILSTFEELPVRSGNRIANRLKAILETPTYQEWVANDEWAAAIGMGLANKWGFQVLFEEAVYEALFQKVEAENKARMASYHLINTLKSDHRTFKELPPSRLPRVRQRLRELLTEPRLVREIIKYEYTKKEARQVYQVWGMRPPAYLKPD